jgi:TonB family protein
VPEIPAPELMLADLALPATGTTWSAPMIGGGDVTLSGRGVDPRGFVEVVPFNTRKPNVPELAWKNQVSGWVLVAFNVSAEGNTRNIRVLDASPRGVFEEKVIAAVNDWRYSVHTKGPVDGDVVVTQKVEVRWQDYPRNLPNVD